MRLIFIFLLCVCLPALAEDTLCSQNEGGGQIHLLLVKNNKGDYPAIAFTESGVFVMGHWKRFGQTKVVVYWEGGTVRIYDQDGFMPCEL